MSTIAALLFDKDGTLFNFQATWGVWATRFISDIARGDHALAERLAAALQFDLEKKVFATSSPVIAGTPNDIAECLLGHLPGANPSSLISQMNLSAAAAPQVEAAPLEPLLSDLKDRGLRLGIATNDAEMPARTHLHHAGIAEYFDFISGFDSGFGSKPHPGPCFAFAEAMRLPPARIAMVGDSRHDLLAGRAAGMFTVAVISGMTDRRVLEPLADVVLDDVSFIPHWLDQLAQTPDAA